MQHYLRDTVPATNRPTLDASNTEQPGSHPSVETGAMGTPNATHAQYLQPGSPRGGGLSSEDLRLRTADPPNPHLHAHPHHNRRLLEHRRQTRDEYEVQPGLAQPRS